MRVTSKEQLLESMELEHVAFVASIEQLPQRLRTAPDVWGDGWTVKDLVLHMTAWEQLFLTWYRAGNRGQSVSTPAEGYTWKETSRLNRDIQKRLAKTSWKRAIEGFHSSYKEIRGVAQRIEEADLLARGRYTWTESTSVGVYLAANTASHYKTGTKILKRWHRERAQAE